MYYWLYRTNYVPAPLQNQSTVANLVINIRLRSNQPILEEAIDLAKLAYQALLLVDTLLWIYRSCAAKLSLLFVH